MMMMYPSKFGSRVPGHRSPGAGHPAAAHCERFRRSSRSTHGSHPAGTAEAGQVPVVVIPPVRLAAVREVGERAANRRELPVDDANDARLCRVEDLREAGERRVSGR